MKVLLGTITWIMVCTLCVISPTLAKLKAPPPPPPVYPTITWNLNDYETYDNLMVSLRTQLGVGKVCNIPVTSQFPTREKLFILVEIINLKQKIITLAFRQSNVYFVGYKDKLTGGASRAFFIKDELTATEKSLLFTDATIRKDLPFGGSYPDIERVAGKSRANINLGVQALSTAIDSIYGLDHAKIGKELATFALVAIQMISEATRFTYIERTVKAEGMFGNFLPNPTFIELETNWGTFSDLIRNSDCSKPVTSPKFPEFKDIKNEVGLLKFLKANAPPPPKKGIFDNNDDGDKFNKFLKTSAAPPPPKKGIFNNNDDGDKFNKFLKTSAAPPPPKKGIFDNNDDGDKFDKFLKTSPPPLKKGIFDNNDENGDQFVRMPFSFCDECFMHEI